MAFFNFIFLALVVSEILGASQIYIRGPCALNDVNAPSRKIFIPKASTLSIVISNCVFNFNFLAVVVSEIL